MKGMQITSKRMDAEEAKEEGALATKAESAVTQAGKADSAEPRWAGPIPAELRHNHGTCSPP